MTSSIRTLSILISLFLTGTTQAAAINECLGDIYKFSLEVPAEMPQVQDLQFEKFGFQIYPDSPFGIEAPTGEARARFDICAGTHGELTLHRVYFRGRSYLPSPGAVSSGLDEALQGKSSGLVAMVETPSMVGVDKLVIRGGTTATGKSFVWLGSLVSWNGPNGPTDAIYGSIVVGEIVEGDGGFGFACKEGETQQFPTFELGTARFELETCNTQRGVGTTLYRIVKLKVTDVNAKLTVAQRQALTLEGDPLAQMLRYKIHHHNGCDSFVLNLGHVAYAASAAQNGGCGPALPEAPDRPGDHQLSILYSTKYGAEPWSPKQHKNECFHYLFCT